jgi:alanine dehydrogenase
VVDGITHYCVANMPGRVLQNIYFRSEQCHHPLRPYAGRQRSGKSLP